jgi:hypothetical protein
MRKSRFSSIAIGFFIGCLAVCGRWVESVIDSPRHIARQLERMVDVMGEFPASSKLRFEMTLAKWRMALGSPDAISTCGLDKSSHHFVQHGAQEKPAMNRLAQA